MAQRLRAGVFSAAVLLLLGALACGDTQLQPVPWRVGVDTGALHFGTAYVGAASERRLVLSNDSRAALVLRLASDAPAFEAPAEVRLAPGAQHAVALRFVPAAPGAAAAELVVTGGDEVLRVALQGEGLAPGTCAPATACASERFDPASGRCERSVVPDGSACAEACLSGATCQRGECVGLAAACDDGNACTRDACGARGCVHLPVALPEAPADRPCQVATCDPRRGVVWLDREDGSACGEATCGTARVCIAGACVQRAQPQGVCGRGCGGEELRCVGEACVAQDGALAPAWRYVPPPEVDGLIFLEVVDAAGNTYWLERRRDPRMRCDLVSADRAGRVRYRAEVGLAQGCYRDSRLQALLDGEHLVLGFGGVLEWRRLHDGGLAWTPDVASAVSARGLSLERGAPWVQSVVRTVTGAVFASMQASVQAEVGWSCLVRLDAARREVRVTYVFPDTHFAKAPLVADERGRLFTVAMTRTWWGATGGVQSFGADGAPGWARGDTPPVLTWGGRLWGQGRVLATDTGALLADHANLLGHPVGSAERGFAWQRAEWCRGPGCPTDGARSDIVLSGLEAGTGLVTWHARLPLREPTMVHTAEGGVLASLARVQTADGVDLGRYDGSASMQVEGGLAWLTGEGAVLQRRAFCEPEVMLEGFTLHRGRVVGSALRAEYRSAQDRSFLGAPSVVAYDVPGRPDVSPRGWATRRGDAGGRGAAW